MILDIDVNLDYGLSQPTDLLLQIEAADGVGQTILSSALDVVDHVHLARVAAQDNIGNRVWLRSEYRFQCHYTARCRIERPVLDITALHAVPPHLLPAEAVRYLMPSRYCPADTFQNYVGSEFGMSEGGQKIQVMRDWIAEKLQYVSGSSESSTSALDTFVQRRGVCRDFAHLMITFARAAAIPARFASVYAPGVSPQDFHAVAEVYLAGAWHLVDPTGMSQPDTTVMVGVGLDAAEVAFLSAFGSIMLNAQSVMVSQVQQTQG